MARKSRTAVSVKVESPVNVGIYKTGIYARLSSEESGEDALENQVFLLESYVGQQVDMVLVETYEDYGFTGTNFERPGFERLMADVKLGRIDCIVVKDLSRLGRNYIETGNLIENIFPFLDIRFVAVTDGLDTINADGMECLVASVKNLVNEVYARDISRKVISAFRTKQRNGEYIGLVAPYGYLKARENKNRFVVDDMTAPVVRRIFQSYADNMGLDAIVRMLDGENIDCPRKYRHSIGITKSERYRESRWCRSAVKTILTNRAYIGDMVQGKVKQEFCNGLPMQYTDKKDWIVVEDTHEPIVGRKLFFMVQELLEKRSREQAEKRERSGIKGHKEENFLKGYLQCGCCGKGFNLSQTMRGDKITRQYYCQGYQTLRSAICTNKDRLNKDEVEGYVLAQIKECVRQLLKEGIPQREDKDAEAGDIADAAEIRKVDRELKSIAGKLADLYQDTADGILDNADYLLMRTEFSRRKGNLEMERKRLCHTMEEQRKKPQGTAIQKSLKRCLSAKKLDRAMVECFLEKVRVYENRRMEASLFSYEEILRRMEG